MVHLRWGTQGGHQRGLEVYKSVSSCLLGCALLPTVAASKNAPVCVDVAVWFWSAFFLKVSQMICLRFPLFKFLRVRLVLVGCALPQVLLPGISLIACHQRSTPTDFTGLQWHQTKRSRVTTFHLSMEKQTTHGFV